MINNISYALISLLSLAKFNNNNVENSHEKFERKCRNMPVYDFVTKWFKRFIVVLCIYRDKSKVNGRPVQMANSPDTTKFEWLELYLLQMLVHISW